MDWEYLFYRLGQGFYTLFIMQLFCLTTIIIYLIKNGKSNPTRYLAIISIASFVQVLLTELENLIDPHQKSGIYIDQKLMYGYLIIEIICSSLYISKSTQSPKIKKIIPGSAFLFGIYTITFWLPHFTTKILPHHIEIIEGFLIITYCLYFFYELFTTKPDKILLREPAFWAISGMLILFTAITPLSLFLIT